MQSMFLFQFIYYRLTFNSYVIYSERRLVVQNQVRIPYIDCISPASPIAILLFFGDFEVAIENGQNVAIIDGWIRSITLRFLLL